MEQIQPVPVAWCEGAAPGQRPRRGLLDCEARLDRGRLVVRLAGELDIFSAGRLARAFGLAQRRAPDPCVLLLLGGLTFSDSSGLGVLVGTFKRAKARGGAVALVAVPEFLVKVLRITGLAGLMPCFPTPEEGWAWLDRTVARGGGAPGGAGGAVCGPPSTARAGRTLAGNGAENTREGATTSKN
jgi:anti-sigma B factor antagonist